MLIFIEEATAITTAVCAFVSNDGSVNPDNVIYVSNDNMGTMFSFSNLGFCVGKNVVIVVGLNVVIGVGKNVVIVVGFTVGLNVGLKKGWVKRLITLL